jgi:hypothetical protein
MGERKSNLKLERGRERESKHKKKEKTEIKRGMSCAG